MQKFLAGLGVGIGVGIITGAVFTLAVWNIIYPTSARLLQESLWDSFVVIGGYIALIIAGVGAIILLLNKVFGIKPKPKKKGSH